MDMIPPIALIILFAGIIVLAYEYARTASEIKKKKSTAALLFSVFIAQIVASFYFPFPLTIFTPIMIAVGLLLYIAGVVLVVWSKRVMGRSWGMPGQHNIKQQDKLVIAGPYRFTRNPIYVGIIIGYLGFSLTLLSPLFFLDIFLLWHFYKQILKEEKLLVKHFGESYRDYCRRVPRFI